MWVRSWVGKIPWRRKWQPTAVFLLGKSHGQRNLAGDSLWGRRKVGHNHTHTLPIFQVSYNILVALTILKKHLWASLLQNKIVVDWPLKNIGLKCTGPHKWSTQGLFFFSNNKLLQDYTLWLVESMEELWTRKAQGWLQTTVMLKVCCYNL